MAKETRTALKKGVAQFMLIGEAKLNDFTYKIDESSKNSDWVYNHLNLGVDCGNGNVVYAEMMGGYGSERDNVIYVHGVKEDDKKKKVDDWENKFTIAWEDRFDEDILETIGDSCFIKIGLEKTIDKNKKEVTYVKKFLSQYDAINYINEHLTSGMVINVKGDLKYSLYNGNVQVKKEIKSVFLSSADEPSKYKATFTQAICIDKDSVGKLDKEKAVFPITARVIDYTKMYKETEVKQNIGFVKTFEWEVDKKNPENTKKILEKLFKVKKDMKTGKDITEATFEGDLIEGQTVVTVTIDDLPEEIRDLIEMGVFSEEEALGKLAIGGTREKRMILRRPLIKMVGDEENKTPQIVREESKYSEADFFFDFMVEEETEEEESVDVDADVDSVDSDDSDWLTALEDM